MLTQEQDRKKVAARANRERARAALETELSFIPNCQFAKTRLSPKAVREQAGQVFEGEPVDLKIRSTTAGAQSAHLIRLCSTPLLKADEEQLLFRLMNYSKFRANSARAAINPSRPNLRKLAEFEEFYKLGDRLRNHIVNANVRLVVSIVKKFANPKNTFDELFSEGVLSLMRAAEKFDFSRGFRFSTYATCAVRRELANFVEKQAKRRRRFGSGVSELLQSSLDPPMPATLHPDKHSQLYARLSELMDELDGRERMILLARYGFHSNERKRTFQNLGDELGVCKERVRQLEARALRKLRTLAGDLGFNPELARV